MTDQHTLQMSARDQAVCAEADECEAWDIPADIQIGLDAGLDLEKAQRVAAMRDIQRAYLELLEVMEYPVDQNGRTHDLNILMAGSDDQVTQSTPMAIAWTAALYGFRRSADPLIKKRRFTNLEGVYPNACTWVDVKAPDDAERDLQPGDYSADRLRPPDVRGLAARRDGEGPMVMSQWHTKAEVRYTDEPRPEES